MHACEQNTRIHTCRWPNKSQFLVIWGGLRDLGSSEPNRSKPNQSTCRQGWWKVCVHLFHSQDKDQFQVFWALLVQIGLGIVHQEEFGELWNLRFSRPKSLNLEAQKLQGMVVEIAPYLRKYKYLVKEVYWWNLVNCIGVWVVGFDFWFLKNFIQFLDRAKVGVEKSFLVDLRWVVRFGLMSQIGESQIEAPIGSIFQKYVYSTFMVKMRIDLGS